MERRNFLSSLTAGLVAPAAAETAAAETDQPGQKAGGRGPSPTEQEWREKLIEDIRREIEQLPSAPNGDLALLFEILNSWNAGGYETDRSSGLCWAIDIVMTGYGQRRVAVNDDIVEQVESVADVLEAAVKQRELPHEYAADERDALIGAVVAFACVANTVQIEELGRAVARHYRRLQA